MARSSRRRLVVEDDDPAPVFGNAITVVPPVGPDGWEDPVDPLGRDGPLPPLPGPDGACVGATVTVVIGVAFPGVVGTTVTAAGCSTIVAVAVIPGGTVIVSAAS